jgi:ankyrin repeat protein
LHYAALTGQKNVVELLITNNADVDAKDDRGFTPLDCASVCDNMGVVELLQDVSARVARRAGPTTAAGPGSLPADTVPAQRPKAAKHSWLKRLFGK